MSFTTDDRGTTGTVLMVIQISLAVLVLLVALAYYCSARVCTLAVLRSDINPLNHRGDLINNAVIAGAGDHDSGGITIIELGLDEATLRSLSKLLYSVEHGKLLDDEDELSLSTAICCSICLADFEEGDVLRLLPDCDTFSTKSVLIRGYIFHQKVTV